MRHSQRVGIEFAQLTLVFNIYVDVALTVRLSGFGLAAEDET